MQRRQITLEDGRYLIFYTFDDEKRLPKLPEGQSMKITDKPDSHPQPQAEEERSV